MAFSSVGSYVNAQVDAGKYQFYAYRKSWQVSITSRCWFDMSYTTTGAPAQNFYASTPLQSAVLDYNKCLYHGPSVSPDKKYLHRWSVTYDPPGVNGNNTPILLCDYLLYYPFIDMDDTTLQSFTNSVSLPRYTDGRGVMMMLVAQGSFTGGASVTVSYTNQNGVSGRTSTVTTITSVGAGAIMNANGAGTGVATRYGPFMPLMSGDTGVRSVESIQFAAANGGICAVVLVKPITQIDRKSVV